MAVASDKVKGKAGIVVQANKNNQIDEIFRSMRTNIQFMLQGNQKVICFTSCTSGEGKTFNAANLGNRRGSRRLCLSLPAFLNYSGTIHHSGTSYRRLMSDLSRDIIVWQFNRRQDI